MKNFTVKEMFVIDGTKFYMIELNGKYGCYFEGREEVKIYESEEGAKIDGLCAYQVITGKKLPKK